MFLCRKSVFLYEGEEIALKIFSLVKKAFGNAVEKLLKKRKAKDGKEKTISKRLPNLLKKRGKKAHIPELPAPSISADHSLKSFSAVQLSTHTRRAYERDLKEFFFFLKKSEQFETWHLLGPAEVAAYRDYLINEKGFAKTSVTRKLAVLKSFFGWNVAQGHLMRNPAETVRSFPQTQESTTGFLTEDQVYRLLDYLAELDLYRLSNLLSIVGIETLLMLGVRRSEACEISYEDIELMGDMWTVRIRGKGGRDRRLPLVAQLQERYELWFRRLFDNECPAGSLQENPAGWIDFLKRRSKQPLLISTKVTDFSKQLSDSELARLVRRHCLKAGIPFRVSPHMLRSTAITHALDQGATHRGVQQMAGWTSPLMISRYDKKRMDPKYSAVHNLQYANKRRKNISEPSSGEVSDNLETCPPQHVSSPPA